HQKQDWRAGVIQCRGISPCTGWGANAGARYRHRGRVPVEIFQELEYGHCVRLSDESRRYSRRSNGKGGNPRELGQEQSADRRTTATLAPRLGVRSQESRKLMLRSYRPLIPYLKKYRLYYIFGVLSLVLTSGAQLFIPMFVRDVLDLVSNGNFEL